MAVTNPDRSESSGPQIAGFGDGWLVAAAAFTSPLCALSVSLFSARIAQHMILVLIAAPTRMGGEALGTLGVIGPKRMHYENTLNAVSYISQVFERVLHAAE